MINTYKYKDETWVDIDHGTAEEIREIMDKYKIHPFIANELSLSTRKPRIEFYENYIYCILHFPASKHSHENPNQEVDFIIGKNILITARYDSIDSLHKFSKDLEVKEILSRDESHGSSQTIFIGMLHELYNGLGDELEYVEDMIDNVTNKIFKGNERQMVVSISDLMRTLLNFKRAMELHRDVLEALHHHGETLFGKAFARQIEMITLDYTKIHSAIHSNLEVLHELRDTNDSMLHTKQNEIMKDLTVMGFTILPLNLVAWIFAMRVGGMPLIENPNGFWMIVILMMALVLVTLTYSKHKKWL